MSGRVGALLPLFTLALAACAPELPCTCGEEDGGRPALDAFVPTDAGPPDARRPPDAAAPADATSDAGSDAPWAALEVSPTSLDFGGFCPGPSSGLSSDLTIRNAGSIHTGRLAVEVTGYGFALVGTDCGPGLGPGETCLVELRVESLASGRLEGSLRARGDGVEASAPLGAYAQLCDPGLVGEPTVVNFGSVPVSGHADAVVSFFLSSDQPTRPIRFALAGPHPGDFAILPTPDSCVDLVLSPWQRCEVTVRFAPTASGSRSANLRPLLLGPFGVSLSGTGE